MKKRMISIVTAAALTFSTLSAAFGSQEPVPSPDPDTAENSVSMTEEWFSGRVADGILSDETVDPWQLMLKAYADSREKAFEKEPENREAIFAGGPQIQLLDTDLLKGDEDKRQQCIREMESRLGIRITDAETTALIQNVSQQGEQTAVDLYEWTFFDYVDENGDESTADVSGYGVDHRILLEKTDSGYRILSDTYNEGELTGMASSDYVEEPDQEEVLAAALEEDGEAANRESAYEAVSGYSPDKAAAYADKWVAKDGNGKVTAGKYNPAYMNMNSIGGDCTNYVSQCIYAGGMAMNNTWFYKSPSNFSGEWSTSRRHYPYMSSRGKGIKNPKAADIWKGCPVYYQSEGNANISHTTICVGNDASGVPVINSHNNDYYHVRWNYWKSGTTYYTVQLTDKNGQSSAPAPTKRPVISGEVLGDMNDDKTVGVMDAILVLQGTVKLFAFTSVDLKTGDVNGDGTVNVLDAILILKKCVFLINEFPVKTK